MSRPGIMYIMHTLIIFHLSCLGLVSCIWCAVWMITVRNTPEEMPNITEVEKKYIMHSLGEYSDHEHKHKVSIYIVSFFFFLFFFIDISLLVRLHCVLNNTYSSSICLRYVNCVMYTQHHPVDSFPPSIGEQEIQQRFVDWCNVLSENQKNVTIDLTWTLPNTKKMLIKWASI
jgi:hypothetical protein